LVKRLLAIGLLVAGLLVSGCSSGFAGSPTYVTDVSATVNGIVVTTDGGSISYWVEYGTSTSYGHQSAHRTRTAPAHSSFLVSIPIAGLSPSTAYHYRVCSERCSDDATFTTDSAGGRSGIAFMSRRGPGSEFTRADILVMATGGSGQTNITNSQHDEDGEPAWSPDGRRVAFDCIHFEDDGVTAVGGNHVCAINANGTGRVTLTTGYSPAWSPDGKRIAFTRFDSGTENIWVMDANGDNPKNLTKQASGSNTEAAWSPDGSRIAFTAVPNRTLPGEIFVMNADGSGRRQLTDDNVYDGSPTWTPDGTRIAFSHQTGTAGLLFDVLSMNPDGSDRVDLTKRNGQETNPSFSPDGSKLAFVDADNEIYSFDLQGGTATNLTNNAAEDFEPAWSPRP
jgi:Tol biopolymer transport system component